MPGAKSKAVRLELIRAGASLSERLPLDDQRPDLVLKAFNAGQCRRRRRSGSGGAL